MARILTGKERLLINFMREYKSATKEQLKEFVGASDKLLEKALKTTMIRRDGAVYYLGAKPDEKVIKALDVLMHFKKQAKWHIRSNFPFQVSFYMNNKVFDVVTIDEGEEAMISAAVNRTAAERVIAIIPDEESKDKVKINKPIRFCIVNPLRFI